MKQFVTKLTLFIVVVAIINAILLLMVPADSNSYYAAYTDKMSLLERTPSPRVVIMAGSSSAFGVDSKRLSDTLGMPVVNLGVHGGIGIRFPMTQYMAQMQRGDILVLSPEYCNYYGLADGEAETMPHFIATNGLSLLKDMNLTQLTHVIAGLPKLERANLARLLRYLVGGSLETEPTGEGFTYCRSGFDSLGDEVSHRSMPRQTAQPVNPGVKTLDTGFVDWLADAVDTCRNHGVTVLMIPPVCPEGHFNLSYGEDINHAVESAGIAYIVSPQSMTVDDSCSFNGGYHVTMTGINFYTDRLITLIQPFLNNSSF